MLSENVPKFCWSMFMMKQLCMCHQQTDQSQQTIEQTKVIQDVVSKLNYALLNKKQGDQIQFFPEKRLEKRKWIHHSCQINIPVDGLCYKKEQLYRRSINSTRNSFICLKMFIMQLRKNIRQWVLYLCHNSLQYNNSQIASATPQL